MVRWLESPVSYSRQVSKQAIASWGWRLSTPMRRRGCLVLMYHRVGQEDDPFPHLGVDQFRRQLEWLAANCCVIEPAALLESARRPSRTRPPVVLTFDDGYRSYYDVVYPVLKKFGMPAVVFPITDYIDHPRLLWWDRLHLAVHHARLDSVSLPWNGARRLPLGGPATDRFIALSKRHLKSVSDDVKERLVDELVVALGDPAPLDVGRQTMSWDEVRATMDLTTYGGHTHTHPLMSRIDSCHLEREIRMCSERIRTETGVSPTLFCYPDGDFTVEAKTLLPRYGFNMGFSTIHGINDETTDRFEVRRLGVGNIIPTIWMMTRSWM